jgi:CarD family transcriptional regulator
MKASAGTAVKGRGAAAPRPAAPRRAAPPVKAGRAAVVKKIAAAPAKVAKPTPVKKAVPVKKKAAPAPAKKAAPVAKVVVAKKVPPKPVPAKPAVKPAAPPPVVAATPKPVPKPAAAPLQTTQQKAPVVVPAPAPPPATEPAPTVAPAPSVDRRPMMPDRPPPRPLAKAEIFVEGDHVVYPTHGVGKVERIATEEIAGHKLELIHITFEENRMTLRVPVTKARTAGLRKLATRKLFEEALAVLKGRARIKRTMWSRRAQEYEAKINSGDPLAIAEVVRDLHRNAGQPDQSFSERQIYEAAMDRLAAELAALDKTDKMTAATKLTNFLKTV